MNAPLIELVIRLAVALMGTVTTVLLVRGMRNPRMPALLPLLRYLAVIVAALTVWRWILLWLGFQTDLGHWSWALDWVQPMNGSLLFLLMLGIALVSAFHQRQFGGPRG